MFLGKTVHHYNRLRVAHIEMKLSTHTYYITPMTLKWFPWQPPTTNSLRQFSLKSLLHFSNLPTMVHMEMKLCAHTYFIVSMTTVNKKCPQALFPITTSHFSNLQTMQCMELKLGTHVYLSVSITTMNKKLPQALFPVTTSSLLKLAHHAMRGGETWYACVFQRFHDDNEQKMASGIFFL